MIALRFARTLCVLTLTAAGLAALSAVPGAFQAAQAQAQSIV